MADGVAESEVRDNVDTAGVAVTLPHAEADAVAKDDALTLAESVARSVAVPHALLECDVYADAKDDALILIESIAVSVAVPHAVFECNEEADAEALPKTVATLVCLTDAEASAGDAVTAAAVRDTDVVTDLDADTDTVTSAGDADTAATVGDADAVTRPGDADAGAADGEASNELPAVAVHATPVALLVGELESVSDAPAEVDI